jgi:hypothetical protein
MAQQFPNTGDAIHVGWVGAAGVASALRPMTSVTDTAGHAFALTAGVGNLLSGLAQHAYSGAAPASLTNRVTINFAADNLSTAVLHDVLGGGLTVDKTVDATGLQADGGNLTTVTATPILGGGMIFVALGINNGAVRDLVGATYRTEHPWTLEEDGGGNMLHEDNGWAHRYPPGVASSTFVWTTSNSGVGDGVQDWAAQALVLVPPCPPAYPDYRTFPKPLIAGRAQGIS